MSRLRVVADDERAPAPKFMTGEQFYAAIHPCEVGDPYCDCNVPVEFCCLKEDLDEAHSG